MPALELFLDNNLLCTVGTGGLSVVRVDISGKYGDECLARLWVDGRRELEDGGSEGTSFIHGIELLPRQRISVKLLGAVSPGAFAAIQPNASSGFQKPVDQPFCLNFESSTIAEQRVQTEPNECGFAFSLVWLESEPDRVRVRLGTYAIDQAPVVQARRQHIDAYIQTNQSAHLRVDA